MSDSIAAVADNAETAADAAASSVVDAQEAQIDAAAAEASANAAEQAAEQAAVAAVAASAVASAEAAQTNAVIAERMGLLWQKVETLETTLAMHSHPELMEAIADLRSQMMALSSSTLPVSDETAAETIVEAETVEPAAVEAAQSAAETRARRIRLLR